MVTKARTWFVVAAGGSLVGLSLLLFDLRDDASEGEDAALRPSEVATPARATGTATDPPSRGPGSQRLDEPALAPGDPEPEVGSEPAESPLSAAWDEMVPAEREEEALLEFHASMDRARAERSTLQLQRAATMLSVLRPELVGRQEGELEYQGLEAQYDELAEALE